MSLWEQQQSESQFMGTVTDYALRRGWEWLHILPGLNERGRYRTPVTGALGSGWPDLILIRGSDILAVELKSERGQVTALQRRVMQTLEQVLIETHVWRPSDWPEIEKRLA